MIARSVMLALAAGLLALAAAGCGDDEETTTAPEAITGQEPATSAEDDTASAEDGEGGGDDPATSAEQPASDEELISAAIEGFLASGDPDVACEEAVTDRLLLETYGDRRGCRTAQTPKGVARSVEVSEIEIDGASATALAVPRGGPSDGLELEVVVVEQDGDWRLDRIRSDAPPGP